MSSRMDRRYGRSLVRPTDWLAITRKTVGILLLCLSAYSVPVILCQNCDRYELQQEVDGAWVTVASGVPREDGVDYQVTGLAADSYSFRVVARYGFLASFPGSVESVDVANHWSRTIWN